MHSSDIFEGCWRERERDRASISVAAFALDKAFVDEVTDSSARVAFGINAIGVTLFTVVSSKLSYRFSLAQTALVGLVLTLTGIVASIIAVVVSGPTLIFMITLFFAIAPLGLVMGTISAVALSNVAPESTGLASALLGGMQLMLAGVAAGIVGADGGLSATPMLLTMLSCALLSIIGWIIATRAQQPGKI